jgi:hypothetical protein
MRSEALRYHTISINSTKSMAILAEINRWFISGLTAVYCGLKKRFCNAGEG